MDTSPSLPKLRRVFVDGVPIEVWDNPDVPFGVSAEDLHSYYADSDWVALFNAITLAAGGAQSV